ncbi:MAG: endoribonuclease MazF [Spirulina sp. SIO3F2]|nr:endoribonuclease MazF [Spirulina sp. SIO3F2]
MVTPYVPQRGDAVWLDFSPQRGREPAKRRPALVLSPAIYNRKVGLFIVCPITNQQKGYPFEVIVPSGLAVTGVILSDQIKSLDWRSRNASLICTLPETVVQSVLQKATTLLK